MWKGLMVIDRVRGRGVRGRVSWSSKGFVEGVQGHERGSWSWKGFTEGGT